MHCKLNYRALNADCLWWERVRVEVCVCFLVPRRRPSVVFPSWDSGCGLRNIVVDWHLLQISVYLYNVLFVNRCFAFFHVHRIAEFYVLQKKGFLGKRKQVLFLDFMRDRCCCRRTTVVCSSSSSSSRSSSSSCCCCCSSRSNSSSSSSSICKFVEPGQWQNGNWIWERDSRCCQSMQPQERSLNRCVQNLSLLLPVAY